MMIFPTADSIYEHYILTFRRLLKEQRYTKVFSQKDQQEVNTLEIMGISHKLMNPRLRIVSEVNRKFPLKGAMCEFLWYMSESNRVDLITPYLKNWITFSDDGEHVNSNYGYQWKDQIKFIIDKLKNEVNSRRCTITLYDKNYASYNGKDIVCTPDIQFLLRDNHLNLIVNARSRDFIWGECIDMYTFTLLQELVANELGVNLGWYQLNCGSFHIYESSFDLLNQNYLDFKIVESVPTNLKYSSFWQELSDKNSNKDFIRDYIEKFNIDYSEFKNAKLLSIADK